MEKLRSKNFDLSEAEFQDLKSELQNGNESLFEHVFLSHFKSNVIFLSKSLKLDINTAHDICMDTLLLFRTKLIDNKIDYGNLNYLFNQMSKQIYIQGLRKSKKTETAKSAYWELQNLEADSKEYLYQIMEKVWENLSPVCQQILELYYYKNLNYQDISSRLGKSNVATRKQKERCVTQMKLNIQRLSRT